MGKSATSFKKLEEISYEELVSLYRAFPPVGSDTSWANVWMWREHRPLFVHQVQDTVQFLRASSEGKYRLFGSPLGVLSLAEIMDTLPVAVDGMERLTTDVLFPLLERGFSFVCQPEHADYVYAVSDLATFSGGHYARKRQLIHHLESSQECVYRSLTLEEVPLVQTFYQRCLEKYAEGSFAKELSAGDEFFRILPLLPFRGGILEIEGEVAAFVIGEPLSSSLFLAHLGKGLHEIPGAFPLLLHRFAKEELRDMELFNFEQDLGITGLKTAKERFFPRFQILKWATVYTEVTSKIGF